jgi:hypothetical protein
MEAGRVVSGRNILICRLYASILRQNRAFRP